LRAAPRGGTTRSVKVGAIAEGPVERLLLAADLLPRPLAETILGMLLARTLLSATRHGVFDVLAAAPATLPAVAARCGLRGDGAVALLEALAAAGYVRRRADGRWANAAVARRWLVRDAPRSLRDYLLFCYHEWRLLEALDAFLRSGEPVAIHDPARTPPGFWELYVRGMRALARLAADEIAACLPLPTRARRLLDVGGAHGEYARAVVRRRPGLTADVLDLPPAVAVARRLDGGRDGRVRFYGGDALRAPLPGAPYDGCLVVNLIHHLRRDDAERLVARLAGALVPGGALAIVDGFGGGAVRRPPSELEALLTLHFRLTSAARLPTLEEATAWLRRAGLTPGAPRAIRRAPGALLLVGRRGARARRA
jgi:SAM-dependent methyltransferase